MGRIIAELAISDMVKSLEFYGVLGFVKDQDGIIDEKGSQWSSLNLQGDALWLIRDDIVEGMQPDEARGNGVNVYITVDDVDGLYEKVKTGGLQPNIVKDIETLWYGLRHFSIADPDGYLLTLSMPVEVSEGSSEGAGEQGGA